MNDKIYFNLETEISKNYKMLKVKQSHNDQLESEQKEVLNNINLMLEVVQNEQREMDGNYMKIITDFSQPGKSSNAKLPNFPYTESEDKQVLGITSNLILIKELKKKMNNKKIKLAKRKSLTSVKKKQKKKSLCKIPEINSSLKPVVPKRAACKMNKLKNKHQKSMFSLKTVTNVHTSSSVKPRINSKHRKVPSVTFNLNMKPRKSECNSSTKQKRENHLANQEELKEKARRRSSMAKIRRSGTISLKSLNTFEINNKEEEEPQQEHIKPTSPKKLTKFQIPKLNLARNEMEESDDLFKFLSIRFDLNEEELLRNCQDIDKYEIDIENENQELYKLFEALENDLEIKNIGQKKEEVVERQSVKAESQLTDSVVLHTKINIERSDKFNVLYNESVIEEDLPSVATNEKDVVKLERELLELKKKNDSVDKFINEIYKMVFSSGEIKANGNYDNIDDGSNTDDSDMDSADNEENKQETGLLANSERSLGPENTENQIPQVENHSLFKKGLVLLLFSEKIVFE